MYSGMKTNPWKVWNGECQDIQDILIISNKMVRSNRYNWYTLFKNVLEIDMYLKYLVKTLYTNKKWKDNIQTKSLVEIF